MDQAVLKDDFENDINHDIWGFDYPPILIQDHSWKISDKFSRTGKTSLEITCNPGDMEMSGTERAEFIEKKEFWLPHGTNVWYSFSFLLPDNFVINDNRFVFAQWKQTRNNYSPFLSFRVIDGKFDIKICDLNNQKKFSKNKIKLGIWNDVLVNYQLNKTLSGTVSIWLNKEEVLNYEGEMGFPIIMDEIYFKMGIYRDKFNIPQTIYLDKFRRGPVQKSCTN